jgi:hypothetical protein
MAHLINLFLGTTDVSSRRDRFDVVCCSNHKCKFPFNFRKCFHTMYKCSLIVFMKTFIPDIARSRSAELEITVACRPVARQRPRNEQLNDSPY